MMSCKKASQLLSQQLDRQLTFNEKIGLRFHLFLCSGCTNFKNNMQFLRMTCAEAIKKIERS